MEPSPVNADGTEVEDTGSTHHNIKGYKDITVDPTKPPLTNHLQRERIRSVKEFTEDMLLRRSKGRILHRYRHLLVAGILSTEVPAGIRSHAISHMLCQVGLFAIECLQGLCPV